MNKYDLAICMPYFERRKVLEDTLTSFIRWKYFEDTEVRAVVSICDDGSVKEKLYKEPLLKMIPSILTSLPEKTEWKCPTAPLNKAVQATDTPVIMIQSPETIHTTALVQPMIKRLDHWKDVVMAPVKAGGQKIDREWCCHPKEFPSNLWFCHMMSRDLWEAVGGMDDEFRDLYAGEDNDLAIRLRGVGAKFKWLPVEEGYATSIRTKKVGVVDRNKRFKASVDLLKERYGKGWNKLV